MAGVLALGCAVLLGGSAGPAPADSPFVNGSGDAVASLGRVVARASGLPLATTFGRALAHYQDTTARAESAALDLGLLGIMLTSPTGCGRPPLTAEQLPKRTVADSGAGAASASRDTAGNESVGLGREEAAARPGARGDAAFTSAALALGELLVSGEGRSFSTAELIAGKERVARAAVRLGNVDIAGGLVSLRGLRWAAEQRTGPGGSVLRADGGFGADTVVVGGLSLPTATPLELAAAFGAANQVIAPLGLRLEPPQVTRATGDRDVRVTPLKLVVGDGTAAKPLLGPVMSGLQPAREALLAAMDSFRRDGCDPGAAAGFAFTFVDVVAAAMQGGGGVDLEVGGVLATTEGVDYGDPFGVVVPGVPSVPSAPVAAGPPRTTTPAAPVEVTERSRPSDPPAAARLPSATTTMPSAEVALPPAPPASEPVGALPATRRCESTSPGRAPGCSRGAPLPASAAALAGAVLLFGADWWRTRHQSTREGQR